MSLAQTAGGAQKATKISILAILKSQFKSLDDITTAFHLMTNAAFVQQVGVSPIMPTGLSWPKLQEVKEVPALP